LPSDSLPRRIRVAEVISSRYSAGQRPVSWDDRRGGVECVISDQGEKINLYSNGGQSSPAIGWEILLTERIDENAEMSFPKGVESSIWPVTWTLYGIAKAQTNDGK